MALTQRQTWIATAYCALLAALSIALQGYHFGGGNQAFYIAYSLRLDELPQFHSDPFYQTLPNFVSAFWWLVRQFATDENIDSVFLALHYLGRAAGFAALGYMLLQLGLRHSQSAVVLLVLAASPLLNGSTPVGFHGLFVNDLTHSSMAWPFVVLALVFATRSRWTLAAFMAAIAFDINAFVGIWTVCACAVLVFSQRTTFNLTVLGKAASVFTVIALPVVIWILKATHDQADAAPFDYREYIRGHYAAHFLIENAKAVDLAQMLCGWIVYSFAARRLGARAWLTVLLTFMALFAIGCIAPYLLNSRNLFNLHLLRVDGAIQFIGLALATACAIRLAGTDDSAFDRSLSLLILLGVATGYMAPAATAVIAILLVRPARLVWIAALALAVMFGLFVHAGKVEGMLFAVAVLLLLVAQSSPARWPSAPFWAKAIVVVVLASAGWAIQWRNQVMPTPEQAARDADWLAAAEWIRANHIGETVLVPLATNVGVNTDQSFQLLTRTPTWVEWKQGSAVMWAPRYYHVWRERLDGVEPLRDAPALADYARAHDIHIFVAPNGPAGEVCGGAAPLSQFRHFSVCRIVATPGTEPNGSA
ncbi:MAG: hypothetical protein R3E77_06080 [Steroidobacteraceae bacterium]